MRRLKPIFVFAIALASATAACGDQTSPPANVPAPTAGPSLPGVSFAALRERLETHAMACSMTSSAGQLHHWTCLIDNRTLPSGSVVTDRSVYRVDVNAYGDAVERVQATVDQAADPSSSDDAVEGFFVSTVGGVLPQGGGPALQNFVHNGLRPGGSVVLAGVRVTLSGPPDGRTIALEPAG